MSDKYNKGLQSGMRHMLPKLTALTTERDTLREEVRLAMVAFGLMFNESDVGKYCPPEHHDGRPCHRPKRDCMECWIEIFFMRAKSLDTTQATPTEEQE